MGWAWADHAKNAGAGNMPGHEHDEHGYDAGGATNGTNQIGELCAVLMVLRAHPGSEPLLIESDSQYAINCSTTWVNGWKRNGWKNSQKKPVKNVELIKAIDAEISRRPGPVKFKWVKGHAGNAGNELVDELARTYAGDCRSGARDGYLPIEGWQSLLGSEYAKGTDVPADVQLVLDGKADADTLVPPAAQHTESRSRSVADLLAEPEGVPDYPSQQQEDKPSQPSTQPSSSSDVASKSGTATSDKPTSPNESASPSDAGLPTSTAAPSASTPASGLTVSGSLRFSPAPKTSPYYNGQPMPITGFIRVEGFVDGDGNMTLEAAPFVRG
ncbi:ribonuclease HI [Bifidobacterium oedipodis]